ncbi:hypothetical protein OG462_14695 [Streptomyces sp. NBC_01077]|uniref:hypothetical protein n=1 Tax=Streptomyces sp. NBC_01077 TaxID=2903746 RepID=UPI00386833C1|nr:hypothetical protein OG462_14695 [Streptomyces sp. NBC_01077]
MTTATGRGSLAVIPSTGGGSLAVTTATGGGSLAVTTATGPGPLAVTTATPSSSNPDGHPATSAKAAPVQAHRAAR